MRAVSCNAPGELAIIDVPEPALEQGKVLLAITHIGICGTDYHIYEGKHPFLAYPRILGHELSATVLDANGSDTLAKGDTVTINPYLPCYACPACLEGRTNCCEHLSVLGVHSDGGMTERLALPEANCYKAEGLSPRDAAMVEFLAIGAHAVRRTGLKGGERVLVVGGGPIGLGVAIFARVAGADVSVLDAAADKRAAAEEFGFAAFGLDDLESEAFAARRRTGFDAVLDATGSIAAMNRSFLHVRNGGDYTLVGVINDDLVLSDSEVHRRELTIRASRNATREDFEHVMAAMRRGEVPTERIATHSTGLDQVPADLARWATQREGLIKAIIAV
ncbi:dehydrogenase [Devosia pacifica]|uniref:Dehydrogenase n=1 Tax=Devosia pacifica TaxID=1335967 RepID=A0A918VWM9_9HYPH|nr:zinc-binding alcohol dehydrogenase family protein [Devosia pacifica]GHA31637.1 dehydrogenase [Devosia pacifica]